MTTQYTIGDLTRDEWLSLLGISTADDPKLAALAALSWGGNALKVLRVNATENGWEFATVAVYTDEQAQDAVGAMVDGTLVYVDGTPLLTRAALAGDVTAAQGSNSVTVTKVNGVALSGLATGILKNTTGTGAPSIALATDFPTLNQNTTGSAAKLTTARTLAASGDVAWSGSFDGSANFSVTATIQAGAVTLAKMANVATATVFYRKTAGTGAPEVQTLATLKTDLGLTGTNSGDQTSVSGNAGTATILQTSRNIDGQAFNGSADVTVIAPGTHAATSKATPVDADELPLVDSAASNVLKKLTWANLKATLKTYLDTLYAPILPKSARVYNSAAISVANITEQALTFNSERWDNDTIHSTASNTSRLTATTAGLYAIGGTISFAASAAGTQRAALISRTLAAGGSAYIAIQGMSPVASATLSTTVTVQTQWSLGAGDYVELVAYQDSGGALNVNAGGNFSPEFFMTRVGPQP